MSVWLTTSAATPKMGYDIAWSLNADGTSANVRDTLTSHTLDARTLRVQSTLLCSLLHTCRSP